MYSIYTKPTVPYELDCEKKSTKESLIGKMESTSENLELRVSDGKWATWIGWFVAVNFLIALVTLYFTAGIMDTDK